MQGLRAIAIILVILAHSGMGIVPGGYVGVDIFFVLSGYLITGLLLREHEQNSSISLSRFYARRLKRLLPALFLMIAVMFSLASWLLSGPEAHKQLASAPFAATWTSNLYFAFTSLDYFDELATRDLFLHTWSLGVEEQFYLVWPVVLLLVFRCGRFLPQASDDRYRIVLPAFGVIFISSLLLYLYWAVTLPQSAFYQMPARIWQLSLGGIVFQVFRRVPTDKIGHVSGTGRTSSILLLGTGLMLILGSAVGFHPGPSHSGLWMLVPAMGAALVIAAGHGLSGDQGNPLASPALVWIGDRSYSLYLWHWPVFILGFSLGYQDRVLPILVLILLSLLASIVSYRLVELPFWKGRLSHYKTRHIFMASFLIMALSVLVINNSLRKLPHFDDVTEISNQWRADVPEIYRMPCDAWYAHARVEPCIFGDNSAGKTVVLIGDSIGAQWFSMVPAIFQQPHWRTVVLTKSSCAMVDEDFYYNRVDGIYQVCTDWRNAVLDYLDAVHPDVIIMGNAVTYKFDARQWIDGSSRVFERASKVAKKVFIIPGIPQLGIDGPGCIIRHLTPAGRVDLEACMTRDRMQLVEPVTGYLGEAADRFPNVYLLDLNDLVCPAGSCNAVTREGLVVFRDSQHLTDTFVRSQIPFIRDRISRFGGINGTGGSSE